MTGVVPIAKAAPTFEKIVELERLMLALPERQVEIRTTHHFAPGIYAREIFIPAGVALVGKIHKTEHLCIVSAGRIIVVSERGQEVLEAPHTFVSLPGTKRAGYALEDTVFTTIHPTTERDLDRIEEHFIAQTREEFLLCHG